MPKMTMLKFDYFRNLAKVILIKLNLTTRSENNYAQDDNVEIC